MIAQADQTLNSDQMTSIVVRSTPVVVEWLDAQSQQTRRLAHFDSSPVSLALFADPVSCTAFLRLRVFLDLEDTRDQTAVYIMIPPEHVASLTIQPCRVPEVPSSPLSGRPALCLRLSMSESATVVGPAPAQAASFSLKPKTAADSRLLASLELLARLHSLVLYTKEDAFPDSATPVLSNISTFKSSPKHADLKCLYEGRGGRPVCWPALEAHIQAPTLTIDSPPAYDAEAETQPGSHSRKRQRQEGGRGPKDNPESAGSSSSVVDHLLDRLDRMEARLAHVETELRQATALAGEHTESLQVLGDAHGKVSDELEDLSGHMDDYVVVKMDDYMDYVKIELQDFVENRLADVEDRVIERVMSATISLTINE
ncbi:hypothetical protein FJTKL_11247 [Diaporthe vaccinii]|uniref:Uncharacterized protein n=1 Tax=Diaporthe vaccinii TaxID=105482 RepID=A0ABR4EHR0_9PEZI